VMLDLRHLGEKKKINERLPMVRELAQSYAGVDPVAGAHPGGVVRYTMGGIHTDIDAATPQACLPPASALAYQSTGRTASAPIR